MPWQPNPELKEPISGGILTTALNAGGFKIANLALAASPSDAVRFDQLPASTGPQAKAELA